MKQLFAFAVAGLLSVGAWAQTDVTSTYITNADFSSTDGWTQDHSSQYWSLGNGNIGTYAVANSKTSTTDATHLASEWCLGIQCRWQTNYAAFTQTTSLLPAGAYTLTFDVQNTNSSTTSATYANRFTVKVGETTYTDSKTEWMQSSPTWTTHTIEFTISEAAAATISLGYGTGSNNFGTGNTPHLYVSHLKLTWTDPLAAAKAALQAEIGKAKLCDAKEGLATAISTAEGVYASATTTTELEDALAVLQAADKDAVLRYENGLADAAYSAPVVTTFVVNGTFTDNVNGWTCTGGFQNKNRASNQSGAFTVPFFENWTPGGNVAANKMYQTIENIPNGTYRLDIAAFVNTLADPNESQYVYANNDKVYLTTGEPTAYEVWTVVTNNQVEIGLEQTTATANWMGIDNVSLRYYGAGDVITAAQNASHKLAWEEAKAAAEAARDNSVYENVIGGERTALNTEIAKAEPSTAEAYDVAAAALTDATTTFTAAQANYDALVAEIAYAKTLGISDDKADGFAAQSEAEFTAATAVANAQNLKVLEYTAMTASYANDVTSLLGTWNKGNYDTTSGQGYIGDETYFDKWNGSAVDLTSSAAVNLPAGQYVIRVAGRGESSTTMNLSVKVGDADAVSTPFFMNGDSGKGIDTDGNTNFNEEGTYSNENNGRGWQYRYVTFTVAEGGEDVTIAINGHLNAGTWQSFYAPMLFCDDATYAPIALEVAKDELKAVIDAAPAVREANIGNGAFQYAAAGINAYSDALAAANAAYNAGDATVSSIEAAKSTFETAIETYNALEINAPADGKLFNVILTYGGWTYDQKAITYMAGERTDMGNYNIKYNAPANQNLAQAFTFTKISNNNYIMSQIDAEGNVRYISNGVPYGGNTAQIRTTITEEDALVVTVIPTATEGVWNLKNTSADNYIGSQDDGVYTVNSHIDFNIVETTKPSITVNTTVAKWGTVMLPFDQDLPSGVKAYTCAAVEGATLTLVEQEDYIEANKPYIIEGAWEAVLTGDAQGTALTVTEGLLTGVYADTTVPVVEGKDSYVLLNEEKGVGFYKVVEGKQPTATANRAYLTVPAAAEVKEFFALGGGGATAIRNIVKIQQGQTIYNLAGQRMNNVRKGVNIIGGKKVVIK